MFAWCAKLIGDWSGVCWKEEEDRLLEREAVMAVHVATSSFWCIPFTTLRVI
jgi:hypothetical protein